jgi:hypothetical protein
MKLVEPTDTAKKITGTNFAVSATPHGDITCNNVLSTATLVVITDAFIICFSVILR